MILRRHPDVPPNAETAVTDVDVAIVPGDRFDVRNEGGDGSNVVDCASVEVSGPG